MSNSAKNSPASGFLIMAAGNFLASLVFAMLWLFYKNEDGERSILLLIGSGICLIAAIAMIVLYNVFYRKLHGSE